MLVNHLLAGSILEDPVRNQNSNTKQGIEARTKAKLTSCKEGLNIFVWIFWLFCRQQGATQRPLQHRSRRCNNIPMRITKKALMRFQVWMGCLEQSPAWKMAKHLGSWNSCWSMEARRRQSVQQTAPTNHQFLEGGFSTTSIGGYQHCNHLLERWSNRLWEL